jgi:hypothetical protein
MQVSVGIKSTLGKALIEGNGYLYPWMGGMQKMQEQFFCPLAKSTTQNKVLLNPSEKCFRPSTSALHELTIERLLPHSCALN